MLWNAPKASRFFLASSVSENQLKCKQNFEANCHILCSVKGDTDRNSRIQTWSNKEDHIKYKASSLVGVFQVTV